MTTKIITVGPDTPVSDVADIIHKHHFTGVPVVGEGDKLLGVIMERDFITADSKLYLPTYIKMLQEIPIHSQDKRFVSEDAKSLLRLKAKDVMNTYIVVASPENSIEELAEMFATKRVNPIPVVDAGNILVGVISRSDLISLFVKHEVKVDRERLSRIVDLKAKSVYSEFKDKFTIVASTRVSVWWVIAMGFLVIGVVIGQLLLVKLNS